MPAYRIKRDPRRNRCYITGDVTAISSLLSDLRARYDGDSRWVPLFQEGRLRAALAKEEEYQARISAALEGWGRAKAEIPADYRTRHGAMYGGTVAIDGERIDEPGLNTDKLPWALVARHETRVRDLTGTSTIDGRVMDSQTLYRAIATDGRAIYRIAHYGTFGDDLRETYYLPADLWEQMARAEIRMRGITPELAAGWLAQYRGCVGTELYEFAAQALTSDMPVRLTPPTGLLAR